jgi:hypothetical protein
MKSIKILLNKMILLPKKIHLVIKEKKIISPYSAKNKRTNPPLANSILNPEINSLSPSLKSNGARLDSATRLRTKIGLKSQYNKCLFLKSPILRVLVKIKTRRRINKTS